MQKIAIKLMMMLKDVKTKMKKPNTIERIAELKAFFTS
jgi:hypothetical protein